MGYSVIRYGVKNGSIEENRGLVEKVFEELNRSAPAALQYLVLELEDGEFVHLVGEEKRGVSAAAARAHSRRSRSIMASAARRRSAASPPGSSATTA